VLLVVLLWAAPAADATEFGVHQDLTYEGSASVRQAAVDAVASVGAQVSRNSLSWADIEPTQGIRDWSRADAVVDELGEAGIQPLFVIVGSPAWASGAGDTGFDSRFVVPPGTGQVFRLWVRRYADFVREAVRRYRGRVEKWELWNEENESFTWRPAPSAAQYAIWYTAVRNAILDEDPRAEVALGGLAGLGASCCITGLDFLKQLASLGVRPDIVAIHPYSNGRAPGVHLRWHSNFDDIAMVHRYLAAADGRTRLWVTEWGWSSTTLGASLQAAYLARSLAMIRDRYPYVDVATYFVDHDRPQYSQGLFDSGLAIKPAGIAFRSFMERSARIASLSSRLKGTRLAVQAVTSDCGGCRALFHYRVGKHSRVVRMRMHPGGGMVRVVVHIPSPARVTYQIALVDRSHTVRARSRTGVLRRASPAAR